jgi:hypothetical protein
MQSGFVHARKSGELLQGLDLWESGKLYARVCSYVIIIVQWPQLMSVGSWTGIIPTDLPDIDANHETDATRKMLRVKMSMNDVKPGSEEDAVLTPPTVTPAPEYASRATTPASAAPPTYFSPKKASAVAQQPDVESDDRNQSVNSIASLGSFPKPPTHFPIPPIPTLVPMVPATTNANSDEKQQQQQQQHTPLTSAFVDLSEENPPEASNDKLRLAPLGTNTPDRDTPRTSLASTLTPYDPTSSRKTLLTTARADNQQPQAQSTTISNSQADKILSSSSTSSSSTSSIIRQSTLYKRGDYIDNEEFGVRKSIKSSIIPEQPLRASSPGTIAADRREMNRSGSNASVLRDRVSRSVSYLTRIQIAMFSCC